VRSWVIALCELLVISPWTRTNYVGHNLTDTTSIVRFIEDN